MEPHAHETEPRFGQETLRERPQQRRREVVHTVVMVRPEAGQVLGRIAGLVAETVAAEQRRSVLPGAAVLLLSTGRV